MQERQPLPKPAAFDLGRQPLGIPPAEARSLLQQDAFKELINKLSWCLGSTYRASYSNKRSAARTYAVKMARAIVRDHGYPSQIRKND